MKKIFSKLFIITFLISVFAILPTSADVNTVSTMSNFVTPQSVSQETCSRLYSTSTEKLFYLTLSAINANNFQIDEIQSKTGYILFTAVNRQFLASILKFSSSKAMLRITPVSNVYYFQPGIVLNMFKYIDLNVQDTPIVNINLKS